MDPGRGKNTCGEGVQLSYCNYGEKTGGRHGRESLRQVVKSEMSEEVKKISEEEEEGEVSHEQRD